MKRPWLAPLVPIYAAGAVLHDLSIRRDWVPVRRLRYPVISIGNLSAGGSGKTPLTITLARLLAARGFEVDVLSRGYGRTGRKSARVRPDGGVEQFGDEPLLIARQAPVQVYVAPERYDAGILAEAEGDEGRPRVYLLDDGFQHRQLHRDIDLLLLDRHDLSDSLLPAGNLRESLRAAMRARVVVAPADESEVEAKLGAIGWKGPVWRLRRRMEVPEIGGPAVAFCGIARPEQFFSGLNAAGLQIARRIAFRDHHRYTQHDIGQLVASARATGAKALITTEKDQIRLETLVGILPPDLPLQTARLRLEIEEESTVLDWLIGRLEAARARSLV